MGGGGGGDWAVMTAQEKSKVRTALDGMVRRLVYEGEGSGSGC